VYQDDIASDQTVGRPCFEINLVPGKGQGVRALKDTPRGTRIVSEKPLFSIPRSNGCNPSDIQAAFEMLSPENKSRFFELHDAHIPNRSRVESTFGTNYIEQGNGAGTFLTTSRINHSCLLNTHFSFDEKTGEETVQAIKDIKVGEEILISYCKPFYTATERQKQLKQWDKMPGSATWLTRTTNPMGAIEGLIDLLEQEGLTHGSLSRTYADAAKWGKKLGRHAKAKIWAQRWRESDRVCVCLDSSIAEESWAFLEGL
jgi:SET domain